jgi:hypothetical protein
MNKVDAYPWCIVLRYFPDIFLFIVIIFTVIVSFIANIYDYNNCNNWFQRSGSIVTVLSAIIEYRHLNIFKISHVHKSVLSGELSEVLLMTRFAKIRQYIGSSSLFTLIVGTIIWGYGDIPFNPR